MKVLKIISNVLTTVTCCFVVIFAILLAGVRLVGLTPYTVISGSMEPNIHVGAVVYVKKAEITDFKVNDCVTYRLSGATPVTHRIIEIVPDEQNPDLIRFRTKGDANEIADGSLLEPSSIVGKPVFNIPYLGYIVNYIQNPPGLYLVIGAVGFIIVLMLVAEALSPAEKKEAEEETKVE